MVNCEEKFINDVMLKIQCYLSSENLQDVKNAITSETCKYNFSQKNCDIVLYDNYNEYLMKLFLAAKSVEGRRKTTIDRYEYIIKKFFDFINNKSVKEITVNDLRFFLYSYHGINGKKNSNTTIDGMRRVLSSFFNWLDTEEYIQKSPARKLNRIKHDTQKERPYTSGEMEAMMLKADNIRDKTILKFFYSTACRVSELCQVELQDIDFINKRVLLHGKGGKDRYVPLEDELLFYLEEYMQYRIKKNIDSISLFTGARKPFNRISANAVRSLVKNVGAKANVIHAHPHRYRVTRITVLLKRGMKLEEVQVIAGHSDINTTAYYNRSDYTLIDTEFRRKS